MIPKPIAVPVVIAGACLGLGLTVYAMAPRALDGPGAAVVQNSEPATREFVVPAGTALRIDSGEPVEILPAELRFKVGQSIRIRNDDDASITVGPFAVDAHSIVTQRFTSPGRYTGECSVHPSGQIVLDVVA